jgi:type II secretory pathway pseudopilin PulG
MNRTHASRGVTLVMAVAVLGLIAITMAMLLTLRGNDFKRLAAERESAQSQQLRLALIAIAHAQLAAGKPVDGPVTLPDGAGPASITWTGTTATFTIRQTETAAVFTETGSGWAVAAK